MTAEGEASHPIVPSAAYVNPHASLPYGLTATHVYDAMCEFVRFLGLVNGRLHEAEIARLECLLMQANFSSLVGEYVAGIIPKRCAPLVRNRYHNGHPDLIPARMFPGDAVQHSQEGIEIKAYGSGWQGHNTEPVWLMVFVFDANRPKDLEPKPFRFQAAFAAKLSKEDWSEQGRPEGGRRTPTASVLKTGADKMKRNWIYRVPDFT